MDYNKLLKKYKKLVKESMISLNVYKAEFDPIINVYSGLLAQYDILTERLVSQEFNIEVETQRGGNRKSATATAQEKLRNDLAMYSDRLMLNPKALIMAKKEKGNKKSTLAKALSEIEKG